MFRLIKFKPEEGLFLTKDNLFIKPKISTDKSILKGYVLKDLKICSLQLSEEIKYSELNSIPIDMSLCKLAYEDKLDNSGYLFTKRIIKRYNLLKGYGSISKFPAIDYCMNLGDEYYIPSIEELFTLYFSINFNISNYFKKESFNSEITNLGSVSLWSSSKFNDSINYVTIDGKLMTGEINKKFRLLPYIKI